MPKNESKFPGSLSKSPLTQQERAEIARVLTGEEVTLPVEALNNEGKFRARYDRGRNELSIRLEEVDFTLDPKVLSALAFSLFELDAQLNPTSVKGV